MDHLEIQVVLVFLATGVPLEALVLDFKVLLEKRASKVFLEYPVDLAYLVRRVNLV